MYCLFFAPTDETPPAGIQQKSNAAHKPAAAHADPDAVVSQRCARHRIFTRIHAFGETSPHFHVNEIEVLSIIWNLFGSTGAREAIAQPAEETAPDQEHQAEDRRRGDCGEESGEAT